MNIVKMVSQTEEHGADEVCRTMRNAQNMLKVFRACKAIQLKSGKAEDSPEILYINLKIGEFEKDVGVLKKRLSSQARRVC